MIGEFCPKVFALRIQAGFRLELLETGVVISDAETSATIGTGLGIRSLFTAQTVYQWLMRLAFLVIYFLLLKWSFGTNPGRLASHQQGAALHSPCIQSNSDLHRIVVRWDTRNH